MKTKFDFYVRGYELDSFNHVNNAVYFNYLEEARWQMIRECSWYSYMQERELFPIVIESKIKYIRELKVFKKAYIISKWSYSGNYIISEQNIYLEESKKLVAKAIVKMLLVSKDRIIYDIPEEFKKSMDK